MFLVRDVFHCKPGKARELAERFKSLLPEMEREDHFRNGRVMVDAVARYWTVVLEAEVETLAEFEQHMREFSQRERVREVLAGYLEMVDGGEREIYRIL